MPYGAVCLEGQVYPIGKTILILHRHQKWIRLKMYWTWSVTDIPACRRHYERGTPYLADIASQETQLASPSGSPAWSIKYRGDGVPTHLIDRYQCKLRLHYILVAFSRFNRIIQATLGTEDIKVAAALSIYSPPPPPPPSCFFCGAIRDDLLTCNGCKSAYFCSRDCQIAGWKDHKPECKRIRKLREKDKHFDFDAGLFFNCMNQAGGTKGLLREILTFVFVAWGWSVKKIERIGRSGMVIRSTSVCYSIRWTRVGASRGFWEFVFVSVSKVICCCWMRYSILAYLWVWAYFFAKIFFQSTFIPFLSSIAMYIVPSPLSRSRGCYE